MFEILLLLLAFLKECNLDVEGLNPEGKILGGFATFEDNSKNIENAYNKAISSDLVSAFGGIVLFNRSINEILANKIIDYIIKN